MAKRAAQPSPSAETIAEMWEGKRGVEKGIANASPGLRAQLEHPNTRARALQNILKTQLHLNEHHAMFTHAMEWFGQFVVDEYGRPGEYAAIGQARMAQAAYGKGLVAAETIAAEQGGVKKRKIGKRERRRYLNVGRSIDALIRAERGELVDTLITRKRVPKIRYSRKGGITVNGKRRTVAQARAQLFRRTKAE